MTGTRLRRAQTALALFLIAALLYARSLSCGFVNLDDESNLVFNPYYHGPFLQSLRWMVGFHFVHWYPLTWLSWALDRAVWGLDPFGFHLTNVLLHAANAALVYRAASRLIPSKQDWSPAAAWAALLFAVHPLRVESVSWATERSDVLSAFFLLWSLCWHLDGRRGAALGAYALSLTAKASGVPYPLALVVLDRLRGKDAFAGKLPYLALAAACAAANAYAQQKAGALWPVASLGLLERALVAGYGAVFYFVRTILPRGLMALYPMPKPFVLTWTLALSAGAAVLLTWLFWRRRRERPELAASWAWHLLFLLPVMGLVKSGPQLVADRYSYLSCLPWALLAGAWLAKRERWPLGALAAAALCLMSFRQQAVWKDSESLWTSMVERDPRHAVARNYLGNLRLREGRVEEAERLLRRAAALDPCYGAAYNNLGNLLTRTGRLEEAVRAYEAALACEPGHPVGQRNLREAVERLRRR